jgi:hypothetical protein
MPRPALLLCPYFQSTFSSKRIQGVLVEEGEGLGPRKELFAMIMDEMTSKWQAQAPEVHGV